jgi:hypothetical protein
MRVEIIHIIWSFRDNLSYGNIVMLGRTNRILMTRYSRRGNKLSCTVEARKIKEFAKALIKTEGTYLTFDRRIFKMKAKTGC